MSFRYRNLYFSCILVIILVITCGFAGFPAEKGDLIVTEIAWMGTEANYRDEWVELYNKTGSTIYLGGWSIYGASSGECLNFSSADGSQTTKIEPYSYLVYGAHKDDVKSETGVNLVDIWDSTVSLNNSSPGKLVLYDSSNCTGAVVDTANQADGPWFAGDNSETLTMERVNYCEAGTDSDNWEDNDPTVKTAGLDEKGNPIKGTPGGDNSVYQNETPVADLDGPDKCRMGDDTQLDGSDSVDCDGYIKSYSWDLDDDGLYDDGSGETINFTCQESTKVSLRVTDDGGATGFASTTIEPNQPPTSDFHYSPSNPKSGSEVDFTSLAGDPDGSIASWDWSFGDGSSSEARAPIHVFEEPGTYSVSLTVKDDFGAKATYTQNIIVKSPLEADAGKDRTIKLGSSVKLKGEILGIKSKEEVGANWKLLEGPDVSRLNLDDSNRLDPIFVPEKVGSYRFRLTLSTNEGTAVSDLTTINVKENPDLKGSKLCTEFLTKSDLTYDKKEKMGLRAEISKTDGSFRGAVIGAKPRTTLDLDPPPNALSFKDLKVTQLDSGIARIDFFYGSDELAFSSQENNLTLFYYSPESGWVEANKPSVNTSENYASGTIPVPNLKGTILTVATGKRTGKPEGYVVHGPNPVPEKGCIFWLDLGSNNNGGKLKIFDLDGKLLNELEISEDQERFPLEGSWNPKDINGNQLDSGIYLYRLKINISGKTIWSEVKKLAIE